MVNKWKNIIVEGAEQRPILLDVSLKKTGTAKPVVFFWHGFKGFKDWGCWELIGAAFARQGFVFIACNFSHNGTTTAAPEDFGDLEAFGHNNFSKELFDTKTVVDWLEQDTTVLPAGELDKQSLHLIGHSRGGGVVIIHAARDPRIKKVITWASVSKLDYLWDRQPEMIEPWRKSGVHHILNGRTKQQMPLYFQLYEDFQANREAYTISTACQNMSQPLLIIHGTEDPAVPVEAASSLAQWHPNATTVLIEGADHVFGCKHPYGEERLPTFAEELTEKSIEFLKA